MLYLLFTLGLIISPERTCLFCGTYIEHCHTKTVHRIYADNVTQAQPAYPRSLIRVLVLYSNNKNLQLHLYFILAVLP